MKTPDWPVVSDILEKIFKNKQIWKNKKNAKINPLLEYKITKEKRRTKERRVFLFFQEIINLSIHLNLPNLFSFILNIYPLYISSISSSIFQNTFHPFLYLKYTRYGLVLGIQLYLIGNVSPI